MWAFYAFWAVSVLVLYFLTRVALKSDPNLLNGQLGVYLFFSLVPFFNIIVMVYAMYSVCLDKGMDTKELAHKIFLVKKK